MQYNNIMDVAYRCQAKGIVPPTVYQGCGIASHGRAEQQGQTRRHPLGYMLYASHLVCSKAATTRSRARSSSSCYRSCVRDVAAALDGELISIFFHT